MKTILSQEKRQKYIERLEKYTLMDDDFMTAVFQNDTEVTETVLQIIMDKPELRVLEVRTQEKIKSIGGRAVVLDVKATDSHDTLYDIEIQRSSRGASPKRARYYSSILDSILLNKTEDTDTLPEMYVIFITENDILGRDFPVYHVDRIITEVNKPFCDGSHILFVNGEFRGNNAIGDLMHDFNCANPDDMKNEVLAKKTRFFKESGGIKKMHGPIMESIIAEEKEEWYKETIERMKKEDLPLDQIARITDLSEEEIRRIEDGIVVKT